MKKVIYILILAGFVFIISCANGDKKIVSNLSENLYIRIDDYKISSDNENFFDTDSASMVHLLCKSNIPEGVCIMINKGIRLNTVSEEMIKNAIIHDTIIIKNAAFEVLFPSKFTTGGYISFEIDTAMQSNKIKEMLIDKTTKSSDKIYSVEYSIDYKRKKNENNIDVPQFPVQLIMSKNN